MRKFIFKQFNNTFTQLTHIIYTRLSQDLLPDEDLLKKAFLQY